MRWRRVALLVAGVLVVTVGGAVLLAGPRPLRASGPGEVAGATASAAFTLEDATVRQVRYADRAQLRYSFTLVNTGVVPLWVDGLATGAAQPTLLRLRGVEPRSLRLGPHGEARLTVRMLMTGCERVSARAGSLLGTVRLRVRVLGLVPRTVEVALPEQLRVGSAREAECPRASSRSRPPG